jgi:hypothetical protein
MSGNQLVWKVVMALRELQSMGREELSRRDASQSALMAKDLYRTGYTQKNIVYIYTQSLKS